MIQTSLAYKLLAFHLLLGEADYFVKQLDLPVPRPIQRTNLTELFVSSPNVLADFGGSLRTTNFSFGFGYNQLSSIVCINRFGKNVSMVAKFDELATQPSLIDTNGAYQLATQWLTAASVDVAALSRKYPLKLYQQELETRPSLGDVVRFRKGTKMIPIFYVKWEGPTQTLGGVKIALPVAEVCILGTTKELMSLRLPGLEFSSRPPLVIAGAKEINAFPDPPFKELMERPGFKLSDVQELLWTSPAYQSRAYQLMLAEANTVRKDLKLPVDPIQPGDITEQYVRPPRFGYGGHLTTARYDFQFDTAGKLQTLLRFSLVWPPEPIETTYGRLFKSPSLLDTNSAYQLATQWLAQLSVDVAALEAKYTASVGQQEWSNKSKDPSKPVYLPVYLVRWRAGRSKQAAEVHILGTTKELLMLRIDDPSFSSRAPLVITEPAELETRTLKPSP